MELKKLGVQVDCANCRFTSSGGCGEFDVTVPVSGAAVAKPALATLHCMVSSERHTVELVRWGGVDIERTDMPVRQRESVTAALDIVAERRVCGSRSLCPSEVVRIVDDTEIAG